METYLQLYSKHLSDNTKGSVECLTALQEALTAKEITIDMFNAFARKARQCKKEVDKHIKEAARMAAKSIDPLTDDEQREMAIRRYGFYDASMIYNFKKVKDDENPGKYKWEISFNTCAANNEAVLNYIEPNIGLSVFHHVPFLEDHTTIISTEQLRVFRTAMERISGIKTSLTEVGEAVSALADKNKFNPITEYLESLQNNHELEKLDVLNNWLQLCLGADDLPVIKKIGRRWAMQAVSRGKYAPAYNESILILLAEDGGEGKTRFVFMLGPNPSYSYEGDPNLANSQTMALTLQGTWFVDFSEGDAFDKKSKELRKRQLTTTVDKIVKKFENLYTVMDRPYVFLMTTNNPYPLDSATELSIVRRHQVVRVKNFDAKKFLEIREQLWFEANRELEKLRATMQPGDKDPYVLMPEDADELMTYSHQFVSPSSLREQLIAYFTNPNLKIKNFYSVDEMQSIAKGFNKFATAQQIKQIMCENLGFIKAKKDYEIVVGNNPIMQYGRWVYLNPDYDCPVGPISNGNDVESDYQAANVVSVDKIQLQRLEQAEQAFMQTEEYKKIMRGE